MKPTTVFSDDRMFRYTLWREWGDIREGVLFDPHFDFYPGKPEQFVQFIGLNPSTADEKTDDATIRVLRSFAQSWGFGGMLMTNLFAFRATAPRVMMDASDPVGPDNDKWLMHHARFAGMVLACWTAHGTFRDRGLIVERKMRDAGVKLFHFGLTANGQPRHPLRLNLKTQPKPYEQPRAN